MTPRDVTPEPAAELFRLHGAISRLLGYRFHISGCEITRTDFCTCGLREAVAELDGAWKALRAVPPATPACAECEDWRKSFDLYERASMALMRAYKRAHPEVPENVWPDATKVNVWAAEQLVGPPATPSATDWYADEVADWHADEVVGPPTAEQEPPQMRVERIEMTPEWKRTITSNIALGRHVAQHHSDAFEVCVDERCAFVRASEPSSAALEVLAKRLLAECNRPCSDEELLETINVALRAAVASSPSGASQ